MAQSKNTPSASAPLFIARSQSRALERAARSSAADHKRAAAATFFAFQSGILSCFAKGPGPLCPRAASAWHVSISRNELTQKPISAYAEVSPSFARTRTHSATFRCVNGVVKSHGFACEVRVTSADTSSGPTGWAPVCASAIFFNSASRCTVSSPTSSTKSFAAESVMAMPCDVAMARTWDGNSYALRGAQSMTALGPTAAAAL